MTSAGSSKVYHDVDRFERRIDNAILRLERECEKLSGSNSTHNESNCCRRKSIWGWVFVMVGGLWLCDSLGWLSLSISWIPLVLILVGLIFLYRRHS